MTQSQTPEPIRLVETPQALAVLTETMDEAISALATFDADRLETIQEQMKGITASQLARELDEHLEAVPELLRKHTLLGEMLSATAANLRVVVAVLEAKRKRNSTETGIGIGTATGSTLPDRSNLVSWPR